ncbi:MAG: hypothetical protein ACYC9O_06820, partial [Candidatus Latescibacterota bacterium]
MFLFTTAFFCISSALVRAEDVAGGQVSFVKYDAGTRRNDIYLIDSTGKNLINLTESRGAGSMDTYSWS